MRGGRLRPGRRPAQAALAALLAAVALASPASPAPRALPSPSTPLTVTYRGSFDLTNAMIPQGVQHSYTYHVEWTFSWSGTWGELFAGASPTSLETGFDTSRISGVMRALWRAKPTGPLLGCTLRIVPDTDDSPDFLARYDPAAGILRIHGLAAPTNEYGHFAGPGLNDVMCGGGPDIDVFGAPPSWKPLGDGGAALGLGGNGVHRYDRTWRWGYSFGHGLRRSYVSSLHSILQVKLSA